MKTSEFIAGKGEVIKWERLRKQNHWFDALYNACAAGHGVGVRLVQEQVPPQPTPSTPEPRARRPEWIDPKDWLNRLGGSGWIHDWRARH